MGKYWNARVPKPFLLRRDLSMAEKFIAILIESYANQCFGDSFPSKETLCRSALVSEKTLNGHLKSLRKKGVVDWTNVRDEKGRLRNLYTVNFGGKTNRKKLPPGQQEDSSCVTVPSNRDSNAKPNGNGQHPPGFDESSPFTSQDQ